MNVLSIEDVDGEGPFAGLGPNAGGGGTTDDGDVLSIREGDVLRVDPTTDSVCEGDIVGAEGGTGLIGGEVHRVSGDLSARHAVVGHGTLCSPLHVLVFLQRWRIGLQLTIGKIAGGRPTFAALYPRRIGK